MIKNWTKKKNWISMHNQMKLSFEVVLLFTTNNCHIFLHDPFYLLYDFFAGLLLHVVMATILKYDEFHKKFDFLHRNSLYFSID